jgi:hypothetical protein
VCKEYPLAYVIAGPRNRISAIDSTTLIFIPFYCQRSSSFFRLRSCEREFEMAHADPIQGIDVKYAIDSKLIGCVF